MPEWFGGSVQSMESRCSLLNVCKLGQPVLFFVKYKRGKNYYNTYPNALLMRIDFFLNCRSVHTLPSVSCPLAYKQARRFE